MMIAGGVHLTEAEHRRVVHIDELVALASSGVDELLASLADPSWTVRRAGIAGLASLGDDAVGPLCAWLCEQRSEERSIAATVTALATSIGGSATAAVIALLTDPRPAIAADAAHILGRRRASEAAPMLARSIAHRDDNVAVAAIEALGAIGAHLAIDELIEVIRGRNFFRTFAALQVLARSGDPRAVGPLAKLLDDPAYRVEAARALGRTGSSQAIAPLASLIPHGEPPIVRLVALALADLVACAEWNGAVGQVGQLLQAFVAPSLAAFAGVLDTTDRAEREALTFMLGRIGDASVMPVLAQLLDDPGLHATATDAIQRIARADHAAQLAALAGTAAACIAVLPAVTSREAAARVRALLGHEDTEIRARACDALARIGDPTAVPELFAALGDPNPRVALAATAAIQSLGVADTGVRAIAALRFGSPQARRYALRIISYRGSGDAFEAVREAIGDADRRIAELAVASLGAIDDPRVDRVLADLARSPVQELRAAAMRAAAQRSGEAACEIIERGLADEFAWVRYYACQGLGRVGGSQAVDQLVTRLADAAPQVRIAAIEALAHLETPAAWQALCSVIRSADPDERRAALVSMTLHPDDAALAFLIDAAGSSDVATQLIALSGLARRSDGSALAALAEAARSGTVEVREAALSLLGERPDQPAADAVVELALACAPEHRVHLTLSRPGAARIAAITARLAIASDHGASILAAALARMGDDASITALFEVLALGNAAARRAAAIMLVAVGVPSAPSVIARIASEDPDIDVRRVCASLVSR
jgi:HEAT repeat protein